MVLGRKEISVLLLAIGGLLFFGVFLLSVSSDAQTGGGSTGGGSTGASRVGQPDEGCAVPTEVERFDGSANQVSPAFNITGNTFRLSYEITDLDDDPGFDSFSIRPIGENGIGVGNSVLVFDEGSGSENILEGPGAFTLQIESEGFEYTVIVEDCTSAASGNRVAPAPGASPAPPSAESSRDRQRRNVMRNTTPNRRLPPTGGLPVSSSVVVTGFVVVGAGLLGLGLVRRGGRRR